MDVVDVDDLKLDASALDRVEFIKITLPEDAAIWG